MKTSGYESPSELSHVNMDKMVFKFIDDSEIEKLIIEQDQNLEKEQVTEIIGKIASDYEGIKIAVQYILSQYMPDHEYGELEVIFTLERRSNFRCTDHKIIVDLGRFIRNKVDMHNTLIEGIAHESFHVYFDKLSVEDKTESKYEIYNANKARVLLRSLNEGFAVKISGQDLEGFYNSRLKLKYDVPNAFLKFNDFLNLDNENEIMKSEKEGFESMGFFYIVGYEMLKTVTASQGNKFIKEVLTDLDFLKIFEIYQQLSDENIDLPKIDFVAIRKIISRK